jgi:ferredoxin-thioredoxin reductase catalytic subunit
MADIMNNNLSFDDDTELQIKRDSLNSDGERTLRVIEGLRRNFKKYGASYCPCKIIHIPDNVCPCKEYREGGVCICGLYK